MYRKPYDLARRPPFDIAALDDVNCRITPLGTYSVIRDNWHHTHTGVVKLCAKILKITRSGFDDYTCSSFANYTCYLLGYL